MEFSGFFDQIFGKSLEEQNPDFFNNDYYPAGRNYYNIGKGDKIQKQLILIKYQMVSLQYIIKFHKN